MTTKKKALGRGMDSLIPEMTIPKAEAENESPKPSVIEAANAIAGATKFMEGGDFDEMLRMIIRLCHFQLDNGYRR